ncbi:hypothetical protein N7494_000201 [Penicillium frequentans]|uniref:4-hydroxyacetophenone monooxygenase n=1 Tax=Penicillium frequentans TaxID=3151616 RepID=A0AAD6D5P9_9EURO|nr:hypothetical protein N7494_000201 [Penicillium glabrum]
MAPHATGTVNGTNPVDHAFIKSAIDKSNLNALRLALLQVTGVPDLANMRTRRHAIRGGAMFAHVMSEEDVPALKEKALNYLVARTLGDCIPPPPSKAEAKKLTDLFGDEPVPEYEYDYHYEELAFKVVVIGGGIRGIAAAVQFKRLGLNFQVLERQGAIGGTWLLNSYPDAQADTSSYLFQFKFFKNYPWSKYFASAGETRKYLDDFNREVIGAAWHEDTSEWKLTVKHADGLEETIICNAIVSGSGLFATANQPDIKGIKDFKGPIFHSSKWDSSVDYKNKRVALLGTGSTGTQLAPAVAREAKQFTVFQRTPNWIMKMDGYRSEIDDHVRWMFANMPYYWNWYCYSSHVTSQQLQYMQNIDKDWQAKGGRINERNDLVQKNLTEYIVSKAEGVPGLLEKILPKHAPLVRRLVVDNGFYDMLHRENVELVTNDIEKFTENGLKTKDGVEREFDIVVLSTGFKVTQYFWPCKYVGRNEASMQSLWSKDGPRSYMGLAMPGFPNFFSFYGPNHQPRSGGFYSWGEIWAGYTALCFIHMLENDKSSMECRKDFFDEYNTRLDEAAKDLIWEMEGHGYYVNEFGRQSVNAPWHTAVYHRMVSKPNFEDFEIR